MLEEAARMAEQGSSADAASGTVQQELARLETVRPLVSEREQAELQEAISSAAARLKRFVRMLPGLSRKQTTGGAERR